jgi:hypothetical protein
LSRVSAFVPYKSNYGRKKQSSNIQRTQFIFTLLKLGLIHTKRTWQEKKINKKIKRGRRKRKEKERKNHNHSKYL